jgi:hypothetical protein
MVIVRVSQYAGIFPLMAFPSLNAIPGTFRILSTELYATLYRGVVKKPPPPPPPTSLSPPCTEVVNRVEKGGWGGGGLPV